MRQLITLISIVVLGAGLTACQSSNNIASNSGEVDDLYYLPGEERQPAVASRSSSSNSKGYSASDDGGSYDYYGKDNEQITQSAKDTTDKFEEEQEDYYDPDYSRRLSRFHGNTAARSYRNNPQWRMNMGMGMGMGNPYMGSRWRIGLNYGMPSSYFNMAWNRPFYDPFYDPFYNPFYDPFYSPWRNSYMTGYWAGYNSGLYGNPYNPYNPWGFPGAFNGNGWSDNTNNGFTYGPRGGSGAGSSTYRTVNDARGSDGNPKSQKVQTPRNAGDSKSRSEVAESRERENADNARSRSIRDMYTRDVRTPRSSLNRESRSSRERVDYRRPRPATTRSSNQNRYEPNRTRVSPDRSTRNIFSRESRSINRGSSSGNSLNRSRKSRSSSSGSSVGNSRSSGGSNSSFGNSSSGGSRSGGGSNNSSGRR